MKYYIQILRKWYVFVRIFISCPKTVFMIGKKGLWSKCDVNYIMRNNILNICHNNMLLQQCKSQVMKTNNLHHRRNKYFLKRLVSAWHKQNMPCAIWRTRFREIFLHGWSCWPPCHLCQLLIYCINLWLVYS